jgi:glycosyltransferase involved in cell wall biosynthesis
MNILIFIYSMHSGGAERVTANLANHWTGKGWNVTIVTLASQALDYYELNPAVKRIAMNLEGESANPFAAIANNLRRVLALRRVLSQVKPDVALAMMSSANILLALASVGLKYVATVGSERTHPPQLPSGAVWKALRAYLYGGLSAVTALTQETSVWLRINTMARKIFVIPNAAIWPLPQQRPLLELPSMLRERQMLLAVGRLSEEKQFDLLIAVFQRLVIAFPNWVLVILGEGPDRKLLEDQVRLAGLTDRILLLGRAGNLGQWYEAADLYVMTSRFEGFPNALVEAMAFGAPVVSFDCDTGPRDIIRHEVDGQLVPDGDTVALERALRIMMGNEPLRRRFAERAIDVRVRFSMDKVACMWEELFERVIRERS